MLQGCRLLKWFPNLPAEHGVEGVKAAEEVSEPTCRAMYCNGGGCLRGGGSYLLSTVLKG